MTSGARVIDSTPPATNRSPSPAITAWHAPTTAESPEAHRRLTVTPATESGRPASSAANRATFRLSSPGLVRAPEPHVLDLRGRDAGALDRSGDGDGGEIVRAHLREPAAVAPDGRPDGREHDGARHALRRDSSITRCAIANAPFAAGTPQ